jgi:hypothetical protein
MKTCISCNRQVEDLRHTCPHCGSEAGFYSAGSGPEALTMLGGIQKQAEAACLVDQGAQLIMTEAYDEAEKALTAALAINPMNATAHGNMGAIHLRRGRPDKAIPWLEKALELNPRIEGIPQALAEARARQPKAATASKATESTEPPGKIAGWLLLPAIALCVQPVGFFYKIYLVLGHAPSNARIFVIWPALWFDCLLLVMVAMVSWGFFRKRSYTPPLFMTYIMLMWVSWAVISGLASQYQDEGLIGMIVHLVVLVPYLLFSRRVAATFVCEPVNPADRFLTALAAYPSLWFRFLQRQRWFTPLYLVLFLATVIVFNAAVRSLYLNGNLSETWRLIAG